MYQVTYRCSNCYNWFYLNIPKKIEAPLCLLCPCCEMNTAYKTDKRHGDSVFPPTYEYDPKTESIK